LGLAGNPSLWAGAGYAVFGRNDWPDMPAGGKSAENAVFSINQRHLYKHINKGFRYGLTDYS
jgi:hypothetical protein